MRSRLTLSLALGAAVLLGSALLFAGPTAAPSASPDAGAPLPRFDEAPFSDEKTPRPGPEAWKPTTPVALTEPLPFGCNAYRTREWVKIRCSKLATSRIALLGGAREDVFLFLDRPKFENGIPEGAEVMFAVRRGDRRVIEWSTFGESYDGPGLPVVAFMISESWAPGDPAPVIIAHKP
jgi:hypothetical protein